MALVAHYREEEAAVATNPTLTYYRRRGMRWRYLLINKDIMMA